MRNHTTHFDDCGCLTSKYQNEIDSLKAKLAIAVKALENAKKHQEIVLCGSFEMSSMWVILTKALAKIREMK